MKLAIALTIGTAGLLAAAAPAHAQVAAETATVTATTGSATARGGRSLGSAIGGAFDRAARTLRTRGSAPRPRGSQAGAPLVIGTGDALADSDATTHETAGGSTVRVSGSLRPRPVRRESEQTAPAPAPEAD